MILVKPSIEFMWMTENPLQTIEKAGRTCYKSEDKITNNSAEIFVKNLLKRGHEAMIEHASMSYKVICDRGVSHEIVRHRLFSFAQESTRYCNYKNSVTFIIPNWLGKIKKGAYCYEEHPELGETVETLQDAWFYSMQYAETCYKHLIQAGWSPQQARSVLPNSLKTEIIITGNMREWRHFFKLRTAKEAHLQMKEVADMILQDAIKRVPVLFDDYYFHKTEKREMP